MERDLLLREIDVLNHAGDPYAESIDVLEEVSAVKTYPAGQLYGFLKEKSFLRQSDLKTKLLVQKHPLYFPTKHRVDILAEKNDWLLVLGQPYYVSKGIVSIFPDGIVPQKLPGWVKKTWVDIHRRAMPTDEHVGKSVSIKAKIKAELGIKLHSAPNPANKLANSAIYSQNSNVTIIGLPAVYDDQNWYKINTPDGKEGWIESRYIVQLKDRNLDALTKEYYVVRDGDMLEPLVQNRYPDYNIKTGDDFRTIVHAFSILNDSNPAIYYDDGESDSWWRDKVFDRDMAQTRKIYASIKLRKDGLIYFPTESYIDFLKDTGKVGQRSGWKNHAIDFGKSVLKFINGFISGCQAIIEDVWEDIKSLFSLSFLKDIYRMIKDIINAPIEFLEAIKGMIGSLFAEVKEFILRSNNQDKFYGIGKGSGLICGMIVQNTINPGAKILSLARLRGIKGISKLIKIVENANPNSDEFKKAAARLKKKTDTKRILDIKKAAARLKKKIDTKRILKIKLVDRWGAKNADKIIEAAKKRDTLRKAMGLTGTREAHHLIPINSLKRSEVVQKAMVEGGFDIHSAGNGIALIKGIHQEAHEFYNELIQEQLYAWVRRNKGNFTGKQARDYLEKDLIKWARRQFSEVIELREYIQ